MPRTTVTISLRCFNCKKQFRIIRWAYNQKLRRKTIKTYCSANCKNFIQRLGGKHSPSWKGGRRVFPSTGGYVMLNLGPNRRMFEHRFVAEQKLGRKLFRGEVVHHLNGNVADNRPSNLVVCQSSGHHRTTYHNRDGSLKQRRDHAFSR